MTSSIVTLAYIAEHTRLLEVACRRCPRYGRLSVAKLIERFGPGPIKTLREDIAHDCPRWKSRSIYELCGVHFPQLSSFSARPR